MTDHPSVRTPAPTESGIAAILARRRWLAVAVLAAVVAGAAGFAFGLPALYRAQATLLVQGPAIDPFDPTVGPGTTEARLAAIKQVAFSRAWLTELVEEFDLYPELRRDASLEAALQRLQRDIAVEPANTVRSDGRSATVAFTVSYVGGDPDTAAAVTNRLSEFYVAQNAGMLTRQASRATERLGERLEDTRQTLESQIARLQAYASDSGGALPQQMDANLLAISRIDGDLRANAAERVRLIERRQTLRNQLAELATEDALEQMDPESRLARMRQQLADMTGRLSARHPDVRQLRATIATLEAQTADGAAATGPANGHEAGSSPRAVLEGALEETIEQLAALDRENAALRRELAGYESRVQTAAVRAPRIQSIAADLQATREVYDGLQQRQAEARLSAGSDQAGEFEQFTILDPAVVPAFPSGPNRRYLLLIALVVGMMAAAAAATAADRLDTSFHSVDELRGFTRVPVLVSVPTIATSRDRWGRVGKALAWTAVIAAALMTLAAVAFLVAGQSGDVTRILMRIG